MKEFETKAQPGLLTLRKSTFAASLLFSIGGLLSYLDALREILPFHESLANSGSLSRKEKARFAF